MAKGKTLKTLFVAPLMCLTIGALASCGTEEADLVVYSNVYTAENENNSEAQAFAVKNGKYIYVGTAEGVKKYIKEGKTEVIQNNGLVIPGCTEGHAHYFDGTGQSNQLKGCNKPYEDVLNILEEEFNKNHIKQFISFGWNTVDLMERRSQKHNFAEEIEKRAPGIPVVLIDNAGHSAVCNKTALAMAGVTKENPTVRGGAVDLLDDGRPTGYVGDQAVFYMTDKTISRPLNDEQYRAACLYAQNELLRYGYTNAVDAFTNMYDPTGLYEALKKMDDEGKLKINLAECYNIRSYDSEIYKSRVDEVKEIVKNYSSSHLHPEYIKLFADGIVEAGTGWMIEPYANGSYGNIIWNQPEFDSIITYANHNGILIHAHTYGDAACKSLLDSFINSNEINGKQYRNCLAHVRNITEADMDRASQNNVSVAANMIWHSDYDLDDPSRKAIIDNIGESRYLKGYQMKTLLNKGINISSSTDAPAAASLEGSVLNVIEVAVTGQEPESDIDPFAPNELLTVKEALECLTINGAKQLGIEDKCGSIKVGKNADFVVLDKNFLNYVEYKDLKTIHDSKIEYVYFEGNKVYPASN